MGYVKLKPARVLNRDMAILFGAEATRPVAEKVEAKAKGLADVKAKHSSVADRIDISTHAHGTHTAVIMSVRAVTVPRSPPHLEFSYFNRWLEHKYGIKSPSAWMPGLFIMSRAKYV